MSIIQNILKRFKKSYYAEIENFNFCLPAKVLSEDYLFPNIIINTENKAEAFEINKVMSAIFSNLLINKDNILDAAIIKKFNIFQYNVGLLFKAYAVSNIDNNTFEYSLKTKDIPRKYINLLNKSNYGEDSTLWSKIEDYNPVEVELYNKTYHKMRDLIFKFMKKIKKTNDVEEKTSLFINFLYEYNNLNSLKNKYLEQIFIKNERNNYSKEDVFLNLMLLSQVTNLEYIRKKCSKFNDIEKENLESDFYQNLKTLKSMILTDVDVDGFLLSYANLSDVFADYLRSLEINNIVNQLKENNTSKTVLKSYIEFVDETEKVKGYNEQIWHFLEMKNTNFKNGFLKEKHGDEVFEIFTNYLKSIVEKKEVYNTLLFNGIYKEINKIRLSDMLIEKPPEKEVKRGKIKI